MSALRWKMACWYGSLWGYAKEMQPACDRAVELDDKDPGARDSRGLARALAGDALHAVEDLRYYLDNGNPSAEEKSRRERWIARLEKGLDPFDVDEMRQLLAQ